MAKQVIQIADKPTVDRAKHSIWLNDYKTYGTDSYVYNNKDILHELYRDYELTMNDNNVYEEVLEFAIINSEVGEALAGIYNVVSTAFEGVTTLEELFNSETAMNALIEDSVYEITIPKLISNNTVLTGLCNNLNAMNVLASSYKAMSCIIQTQSFIDCVMESNVAITVIANAIQAMTAAIENSDMMTAIAENEEFMNAICINNDILLLLYENATEYSDNVEIFLKSSYLLSACQLNPNYEVSSNNKSILHYDNGEPDPRVHYDGKCLVLGCSQTYSKSDIGSASSSYIVFCRVKNCIGITSSIAFYMSKSYGTTGLVGRVNKFASRAAVIPSFSSPVISSTSNGSHLSGSDTTDSYMAYLKLE